jgi:M6 family metalloprotease-like protein
MFRFIKTAGIINPATGKRMFFRSAMILIVLLSLMFSTECLWAAPFSKYIHFTQPDNTQITLWGEGDEFHAVFETTTGYTVVFDPQKKAYFYAERSTDGKNLLSTGVLAHHQVPPTLARHARVDPDAVSVAARARHRQWDQETGLSKRWRQLKSQNLGTPLSPDEAGPQSAPPSTTTLGTKVGLTILIDFSDAPAAISQAEINSFLNGDSYTNYGNNGSVKKYYSDVSGGRLTYTNVVTAYVRMNHPKSYYNNTSIDNGTQGRLLINDALAILKARSDYNSTILPTLNSLTTDSSNNVLALNVYFAGDDSGVWAYGLWPHSWVLASPVALGNGKYIYHYQITNVGDSLELGTFCHENGHMLCGFPDLYDYDYDSVGGAGKFSLMGYGGSGHNPSQVDAYLKTAAGWTTVTDITSASSLTGTLVAAPNSGYDAVYRFRKPGTSTEYFLLENRQKTGRDTGLPAAGIAVWHVDELGDKDNQSLIPNSSHQNYELTLVQADNLWHFETTTNNSGDANDLYYQGNSAAAYTNILNDNSAPNAHWWDGTGSGMSLNTFSVNGQSMSFTTAAAPLAVTFISPANGATGVTVTAPVSATFNRAINESTITNSTFTLKAGNVSVAGTVSYSSANLTATFTPSASLAYSTLYTATISTDVEDANGHQLATSKIWNFTTGGENLLVNGGFENGLTGWGTAQISGTTGAWTAVGSGTYPSTSPHGGTSMADFNSWHAYSGSQTRLYQTTGIAIPSSSTASSLSFWMSHDTGYSSAADQLQVQVSTDGSSWSNVGSPVMRYNGTTGWSQVTLDLSAYKGQSDVRIGFLGTSYYGNDIYLDDLTLNVTLPLMRTLTVNFPGNGSGSVTINPGNIVCNDDITRQFADGTPLTISGAAFDYSDFTNFTGDCTTNPCNLTMNGPKNVNANITKDTVHKARIGASNYFPTLPAAYLSPLGTIIKAWGTDFAEPLSCGAEKDVTIDGGYNDGYSAKSGYTLLQGPLIVERGSLTVEYLIIR